MQCSKTERKVEEKVILCGRLDKWENVAASAIDCTNSISPACSRLFPRGARVLNYCERHVCVEYPSCSVVLLVRRSSVESLMRTIKNIDMMLITEQSIDISWSIKRDVWRYHLWIYHLHYLPFQIFRYCRRKKNKLKSAVLRIADNDERSILKRSLTRTILKRKI